MFRGLEGKDSDTESQLENYQKAANNNTHGFDGPIAISNGGAVTALAQDFLRASDAIGVPYSGLCCFQ